MKAALLRWGPVVVWMTLIFIGSAQPSPPRLAPPEWELLLTTGAHVVEYVVLGALLARALLPRAGFISVAVPLAAWGIAVGYGASDEMHQAFVPGRTASLADWLADGAGALGGVAAYLHWWTRKTGGR